MDSVFDPWRSAAAWADVVAVTRGGVQAWRMRREQRLAVLLAHAHAHARAYRERCSTDGRRALALADFAPVGKAELMARFDDWVTDATLDLPALRRFVADPARVGHTFAGRYLVWESSGSTCEPALYVQDAAALAVADALEAARGPVAAAWGDWALWRDWAAAWPAAAGRRLAFVGATEGHFASIVSLRRACGLNPWLAASLRCLSFLQPIDRLVAALNDWQPAVLSSYPSMAWVLAQEQAAGRLRIAPRQVWTGGETLSPALRRALARCWGATVRDSYGASECLEIASECPHGALHLHADWVVLEPVDERLRPLPPGQTGHTTLLTNLANRVQPVIRCDIGDRVCIRPEPCACGCTLPVIEVQGRQDDVLTLSADGHRRVHLPPLALSSVLEEEAGLFDFELHQRDPRSLRLLVDEPGAGRARLQQLGQVLRHWLAARGLAGVRVRVQRAGPDGQAGRQVRRLGRSGKRLRIVRDDASAPNRPRPPPVQAGGWSAPSARSAAKRVRQASKRPSSSAWRTSRIRFT